MYTPSPMSDLQRTASRHSVIAKRARGVVALAGCFIVMILIILGIANIVQAQSTPDALALGPDSAERSEPTASEEVHTAAARLPASSVAWRNNIGKQSAIALQMPGTAAKDQTLQNLIILASQYGDALDLSEAVPTIVRIYEQDENENLRTMALAALHAIGDEEGMQRVLELFADPLFRHRLSPRLRHITHATLAAYLQSNNRRVAAW